MGSWRLSDADVETLVEPFTRKAMQAVPAGIDVTEEFIRGVVGTVVADTVLTDRGVIPMDAWDSV